jgi:hypothetical protein
VVHADGAMVVRDHTLFRTGPEARGYCTVPSEECDRVLSKVLSGYGYFRGALRGGVTLDPQDTTEGGPFAALHIDAVSASLPGGDMAIARIDGVLGPRSVDRLRVTLIDLENVFGCVDARRGKFVAPFVGMTTSECRTDAVFAVDLRLLRLQWDVYDGRVLAEWASAGPAFELLGNGLGQAHLLRSVVLALPFDVQSQHVGKLGEGSGTSVGGGLRLSAMYRTPHWESRLGVRHRTILAGRGSFAREHGVEGELRLLRNWFVSDGLALQAGLSVMFSWASQPWAAQALLATSHAPWGMGAGLYLGWVGEAPAI